MGHIVDFVNDSTEGVESSPVAEALAGLRANEARYFKNKYDHTFEVHDAGTPEADEIIAWVTGILADERGIVATSPALQAALCEVDGIKWAHVFYESGMAINVLYGIEAGGKRAVGFKLSQGMEVPPELSSFKFARQRSKLAGEIRGSFFVIKGEH